MLNQDFREFIESLNANKVRYLVIGGYAVAFHGNPRYTKDLDIWVEVSSENASRMITALNQFGFSSLEINEQDILTKDQVIQLGNPPNRIDLHNTISGVEFSHCYESRIKAEIDDIVVNFIDLEALKKNKSSSGRHQDLADLEKLK